MEPSPASATRQCPKALRISYITMRFPLTSEAFAGVELRSLRRLGVEVSVHAMRPRSRRSTGAVRVPSCADTVVSHNSFVGSVRGVGYLLANLGVAGRVLIDIFRSCWRNPSHVCVSLGLLPRAFEIAHRLRKEKPDIVHLFWGHYPSLVGQVLRCSENTASISMFLGAYDLVKRYGCSTVMARQAPVVWTHAAANIPAILNLGVSKQRIIVSHRGVSVRDMPWFDGDKIPRSIILVERLVPPKRTHHALEVFARIHLRYSDARLVIVGDGPERNRLESLAEELGVLEFVRFEGNVDHSQVFEHLSRASIFLSMSQNKSERLPNALKEAMYYGCACVVTDTPGIRELLTDDSHGLIVVPGCIEAAADGIQRLFSDKDLWGTLSRTGQAAIRQNFDVDVLNGRRMEVWRQLVDEGSRIASPFDGDSRDA